ncbi:MAG: alpha/beta hydrolase [Deltaproteobacteria bacterium]|nr:alpha/beta hydrolase [Deltaproteobacteria bacterium]
MNTQKFFIHGSESSAQGNKGRYFSANFSGMVVGDFCGGAQERLAQFTLLVGDKQGIVIVGSSYGGLVGAMYALKNPAGVKKLIMLAPALDMEEFAAYRELSVLLPAVLFHGSNDTLVPAQAVKKIAKRCFPLLEYHLVKDDHSLTETFPHLPWRELLA